MHSCRKRGRVKNKKVLVVGTGALATLFAARLSASGTNVTMLGSWTEGLAALNRDGARLEGLGGFPVRATADPAACTGMNLALVLVKSFQTLRVAALLEQILIPGGLALTLQNGLGNDLLLANALGAGRVARGITTLGATLTAPGVVRLAGEGPLWLEAHPQIAPLTVMLQQAGFPVEEVADIRPRVWGKLVVNAAINPLTALLRVKNGLLLQSLPVRELMGELAEEAAAVAVSQGVRLPFPGPRQAAEEVAQRTGENLSSMLRDVLRGAPTEVDTINGAVVRLGEENGIPVPVNRTMWALLKEFPFMVR